MIHHSNQDGKKNAYFAFPIKFNKPAISSQTLAISFSAQTRGSNPTCQHASYSSLKFPARLSNSISGFPMTSVWAIVSIILQLRPSNLCFHLLKPVHLMHPCSHGLVLEPIAISRPSRCRSPPFQLLTMHTSAPVLVEPVLVDCGDPPVSQASKTLLAGVWAV